MAMMTTMRTLIVNGGTDYDDVNGYECDDCNYATTYDRDIEAEI